MTHADLVKIAAKWLRGKGCGVVLTELSTVAYETPDAIGWRSGFSILVECKVSRGDFLRDAKKFFRLYPDMGVGTYRFYMCPEGVIKKDDLPEGWGLVWVDANGKARQKVGPKGNCWGACKFLFAEKNMNAEQHMLVSALRRAQNP